MDFRVYTGGKNGHTPPQITQVDLENALLFYNRTEEQRRLLGMVAERIRDKLKAGASVEIGVHVAESAQFELAGVTYEALLVDGRVLMIWAKSDIETLRRVFWA